MAGRDEIFGKVRETLAEALGVDQEEVIPKAVLIADLGADPAGLLEIELLLENAFGILIPLGELFLEDMAEFESSYVERGFVTEHGIEALREQLPHADVDEFAEDPRVEHIQNLFTVEMIVRYLEAQIDQERNP